MRPEACQLFLDDLLEVCVGGGAEHGAAVDEDGRGRLDAVLLILAPSAGVPVVRAAD